MENPAAFPVHLRIPGWAGSKITVGLNGQLASLNSPEKSQPQVVEAAYRVVNGSEMEQTNMEIGIDTPRPIA